MAQLRAAYPNAMRLDYLPQGEVAHPLDMTQAVRGKPFVELFQDFFTKMNGRPLTVEEIHEMVDAFAKTAKLLQEAGVDGVEIHAVHEGYLLDQLTSPAFNHRKIGKYADWQRFGVDMIKAIRRKVGPNYPIMYRIDLSLALNETYGDRMDTVKSLKGFKNGRSIADTLNYVQNYQG